MALIAQNLAAVLNKTVDIDIQEMNNPRVSCVVALFLLSLVFLVLTHGPLVHALAWVILNADNNVFKEGAGEVLNAYVEKRSAVTLGFMQPVESLEQALDGPSTPSPTNEVFANEAMNEPSTSGAASRQAQKLSIGEGKINSKWSMTSQNKIVNDDFNRTNWTFEFHSKTQIFFLHILAVEESQSSSQNESIAIDIDSMNITDEEKEKLKTSLNESGSNAPPEASNRPFLDTVLSALDCSENDYLALLSLCLIYAMANNKGKSVMLSAKINANLVYDQIYSESKTF